MLIKFAIASNINFEEKSIPIIIESLLENGIDPNLIHVFSGGYDEYRYTKNQYHYHQLEHNSYEYSPLITIVERNLESEYWFLLHDTCKVGPKFKELVYNIPEFKPEKIALHGLPSMSIGAYRYDYLISDYVKNKLLKIKNTDYSEKSMMDWKFWGVAAEDYILHQTKPNAHYYAKDEFINYTRNTVVVDYNNWYATPTIRRTEYYISLDLYKNKSNWGTKSPENYIIEI